MLEGLLRIKRSELPVAAEVKIDFDLGSDRTTLCRFLKRLKPILELGKGLRWTLDLIGTQSLGPNAASLILATCLEADALEQVYEIRFDETNAKARAFCEYSGLNRWMDDASAPDKIKPYSNTVELCQIRHASFDDPSKTLDVIRRFVTLGKDDEFYLRSAIYETIQNVEDHSQSRIGAILSAKFVQNKKKIRIAIVDRGHGVYTTLRGRFPDTLSAEVALLHVIHGGYSAKSRNSNMGLGISNLWNFVARQLHGQICIVSEECVVYNNTRSVTPRFASLGFRFPGTGVFLNVPVSVP